MSELITPDEAIEVCLKEGAMGISLGLAKNLQAERNALRASLTEAKAALAETQSRLDATLVAALRYESRHDLDLERGKLWGELKEALMVYRLQSPPKSEPCLDCDKYIDSHRVGETCPSDEEIK